MRTVNETFEDEDFDKLEAEKGLRTWREFILTLLKKEGEKDDKGTNIS